MEQKCPHCSGYGCDPDDPSTLLVRECPACNGTSRMTGEEAADYEAWMAQGRTWIDWIEHLLKMRRDAKAARQANETKQ